MTRISVELDSELNWSLKNYCLNRWRSNPYGHQQQVMRDALTEYLAAHAIKPQEPPKESEYGMPGDGQSPDKEPTEKPHAAATANVKPIDDPEKVAVMKQMLLEGRKISEIHKKTGIPASTIRSRIKSHERVPKTMKF
jgi:DNA-directed RNA polymerase specialized sigma24 family protein